MQYMFGMEMEAVVHYCDEFATYRLTIEEVGIYHARLMRFFGSPDNTQPNKILIVCRVRKWLSSCKSSDLVNDLGRVIESTLSERERVLNRTGGNPLKHNR